MNRVPQIGDFKSQIESRDSANQDSKFKIEDSKFEIRITRSPIAKSSNEPIAGSGNYVGLRINKLWQAGKPYNAPPGSDRPIEGWVQRTLHVWPARCRRNGAAGSKPGALHLWPAKSGFRTPVESIGLQKPEMPALRGGWVGAGRGGRRAAPLLV
jgi:hypothetical protein